MIGIEGKVVEHVEHLSLVWYFPHKCTAVRWTWWNGGGGRVENDPRTRDISRVYA